MPSLECQVVVLGGGGVGKSALTVQFVHFHFVESYDPTIEDYYRRQVVFDGEAALVSVLDTAGQEEYSAMRPQYLRQGKAFLLCYSTTDRDSLRELTQLRNEILMVKEVEKAPIVLVGTKKDLTTQRQVATEEAAALAKEWGVPFFETSAFTRENVDEAFFTAVRETRLQDPSRQVVSVKRKNSLEKSGVVLSGKKRLSGKKTPSLCTIC